MHTGTTLLYIIYLLIVRNKNKECKELLYSENINLKATTTEEKNGILMNF